PLAMTLLDWKAYGTPYATEMTFAAKTLANELHLLGLPVYAVELGATYSHAFAVDAREWGGGHAAALRLRKANLLATGIGLPTDSDDAPGGGLRLGLNEPVRWGLTADDMAELAALIVRGLNDDDHQAVARDVTAFRRRFSTLHFVR
ncbi:MAG: serine hydroxymethyltransferase, partial [Acidimicrobiales bacterium]